MIPADFVSQKKNKSSREGKIVLSQKSVLTDIFAEIVSQELAGTKLTCIHTTMHRVPMLVLK